MRRPAAHLLQKPVGAVSPGPLWTEVYDVLPLSHVDGFAAETVLGAIAGAPAKSLNDPPGMLNKEDLEAAFEDGILGPRLTNGSTNWPNFATREAGRIRDALTAYVRRYADAPVTANSQTNLALAGSPFAIRAIAPLIDTNEALAQSSGAAAFPVTTGGAPIVGSRWETIGWADVQLAGAWPQTVASTAGASVAANQDLTATVTMTFTAAQAALLQTSEFWAVSVSAANNTHPSGSAEVWGYGAGMWTPALGPKAAKRAGGAGAYALTGVRFAVAPPTTGGYQVCVAPATPRVVTLRKYTDDPSMQTADGAVIFGPGPEETVCVIARFITPGARPNGGGEPLRNYGPPTFIVRRLHDSRTPAVPIVRGVKEAVWNLECQWRPDVDPSTGNVVALEIQVGYRLRAEGDAARTLAASPSLAWAFSQILSGQYNLQTKDARDLVLHWLRVGARMHLAAGMPWTILDPRSVPNPGSGAVWLFPDESADPTVFTAADTDVLFARREQFELQFQLRAVDNPNDPRFAIRSDWTLPLGPFSSLPRRAEWVGSPALSALAPGANGPRIEFNVEVALPQRTPQKDRDDLTARALDYRLILRRTVDDGVLGAPKTGVPSPRTIPHQTIVNPQVAVTGPGAPSVTFAFTDFEIAPPDVLGTGRYAYELQIEQGRRTLAGEIRDVSRGPTFALTALSANTSVALKAQEP